MDTRLLRLDAAEGLGEGNLSVYDDAGPIVGYILIVDASTSLDIQCNCLASSKMTMNKCGPEMVWKGTGMGILLDQVQILCLS